MKQQQYLLRNNGLLARMRAPLSLVLFFLFATLAAKWRFWPWVPEVFFGDDLANLLAYKGGDFASSFGQAFTAAFVDKFRPVFALIMRMLFAIFEERILSYLVLNVLVHGIAATLVFLIAYRLSRANLILSTVIALAVATSRFALYQVTQVTGLLEGIALIFFLGTVYCVVRASEDKDAAWPWTWLGVAAAFLAMHTHERYVVLGVWICFALILQPNIRMLPRSRWLTLLGACIAMLLFNLLYKVVALQMPFFVGTGGTHLSFSLSRSLEHAAQAMLSIFGFNEGPEYLVGARSVALSWFPAWPLAAVMCLTWVTGMVLGLRAALRDNATAIEPAWQRLRWPLLLLALGAFLLVPPILTIRLEQRWVLEPFILMLFLFAWAGGSPPRRNRGPLWVIFALTIGGTSVLIDSIISRHFGEIFFVVSGRFAAATKRDIVDKNHGQTAPIGLLARQDHCDWTLQQGEFFRLYGGAHMMVSCFASADHLLPTTFSKDTRIYAASASPLRLTDVTADLSELLRIRNERTYFDFLTAFPEGRINDTTKVDTPTSQGVMALPWESMLGLRKTLTIISGFSYRYDAVPIERNVRLRFGVSMIYPAGEPARAVVRIHEEGGATRLIFSGDLTPPLAGEKPHFEPITISPAEFAGEKISVTFAVETPGRNSSGHWVGFAEPRIVRDDSH